MEQRGSAVIRQIVIVVVAIAILGAAMMVKSKLGERPAAKKRSAKTSAAKTVQVFQAENKTIQTKVPLYGRLAAFEKTELYSEVSGMLVKSSQPFRAGTRFKSGTVLLQLDAKEQALNLQAQRSALLTSITQMMPDLKTDFSESLEQWDNYRNNLDLKAKTPELPTPKSDREKDYVTLRNIYNQFYNIKSLEERLGKYIIRAPFSGEITESFINTGSFIRAGQKIGTLMNTSNYELEASIPLKDMQYVKIGDKVKLSSEDIGGEWTGRIHRIGNTIDTKTQTVKLYIKVNGKNLRENMFLTGTIEADMIADVIEVPRRLLVNNEAVYTIKDSTLSLKTVQLVKLSENTALIQGVPNGSSILQERFTGAYDGMKVQVAN
ncbi:MAG: HlyD family efflux transporter periplasmic adaptor subunit [Aureispira sp.]|nr:HlyD family efflux transporter periplasmic adaptor subunit [Aureispira sp.]